MSPGSRDQCDDRVLDPRFPPMNLHTSTLSHPPLGHICTIHTPPYHSATNTSPPCSSCDLCAHGTLLHHRQHIIIPTHRSPRHHPNTWISTSPPPSCIIF